MTECTKDHITVYFAKTEDCPVCKQIGITWRQDDEIVSLQECIKRLSVCLRAVTDFKYEEAVKESGA